MVTFGRYAEIKSENIKINIKYIMKIMVAFLFRISSKGKLKNNFFKKGYLF